ncbi:hypothetical protein [Paenibacillus piri]|uniref:Lipoprotein n=1 Tax=Paenibacillus piri TaxID=2547395 RepID=A0A4R5KWM6_9BACL|nr:hypothetical protein [Paenibacillus piri]TDG00414.1 hypothetical protein E1757_01905 [Paenibacillus piri]
MRKQMMLLLVVMFALLSGLTACTKTNKGASGPAVLQGQSEHWKVVLEYTPQGNSLEETVTVQTSITEQTISEMTATINHKNQKPVSYQMIEPEMFKGGQPIKFPDKSAVADWKDTEQVEIEWKTGDRRYKEYISVANAAAAPAK